MANHSLASRTWSTYQTVENHLTRCQQETSIEMSFPMDTKTVIVFTHWLVHNRKVKGATVDTYIAGLRQLHLVRGHDVPSLRPPMVQQILTGKKNIYPIIARETNKPNRLPVTLNVMKLLKHEIKHVEETTMNKTLLWSVCTLAFNSCLRIHELLARKEDEFDPQSTLLLKDIAMVTWEEDNSKELKLNLKSPKEDKKGKVKIINIYKSKGAMCPIKAFQRWQKLSPPKNRNIPIFCLESGVNLTGRRFNRIFERLLSKHIDYRKGSISSHSFQSGLATLMGQLSFPDHEIMAMGRWSSNCFET